MLNAVLNLKIVDGRQQEHEVGAHKLALRSPGDILGIARTTIARVEPPPQTHDFEPNYFPFVEFVDPDLPWRYTLDTVESTTQRVFPWLSLIVLSTDEMAEMAGDDIDVVTVLDDRRQFLSVRSRYLPDLKDSWATAHVHISGLQGPIENFIEQQPSNHCSRLFCFRRLAAETNYMAFLVPTYKIAVQAAFGLGQEGAGSEPAWSSDVEDDIMRLPVYYSWPFSTSATGDFEQLARNLQPTAVDEERVGIRAIDANLMTPFSIPLTDRYFLREGALAAPGFSAKRSSYDAHSRPLSLTAPLLYSLNESLIPPDPIDATIGDDDLDPLITFPVYGQHYRFTKEIKLPENGQWPANSPWVHELNLDFRHRTAASFGTTVVQKDQDQYMRACWSQVGEIRKANEKLRLAKAAQLISQRIQIKHLDPLSDQRFSLISAPFHAYAATAEQGDSVSIKKELADSGISRGVFSSAFRRAAHRQIKIENVQPDNAIKQAKAGFVPGVLIMRKLSLPHTPSALDPALGPLAAAGTAVIYPKQEMIPVKDIDFSTSFRTKFDIDKALGEKIDGLISYNDDRQIPEDFEPNIAHPRLEFAMYAPLSELSNDYILPGIETIANNGVTLCEENRRFIEAYMVGLNHEMGREMVWRGFPTDSRGTVFSLFWDQVSASSPRVDIKDIHKWNTVLGDNNQTANAEENLVLVVKGDLIRRYPGTIVYALRISGQGSYWSKLFPDSDPPMSGKHKIDAIMRARVGPDILCVGFPLTLSQIQGAGRDAEYYFILQENQDLPRFGLDVASKRIAAAPGCEPLDVDINDLSWSDVALDKAGYIAKFPAALFAAGGSPQSTSASIAGSTYQLPIRVAIHASELLPGGNSG
ncbi:MAG: hypothetical protein R3293_08585 [Candidatus Promineifilaceae bacterium]|nr:hypothetical protein [Candidatus Promineifilaceae bacterium]